jgi:hypothetical protein
VLLTGTKPAYCVVIDQFFKLERVCEEIHYLNIKIPDVVTYIQDEDTFLWLKEDEVRQATGGKGCASTTSTCISFGSCPSSLGSLVALSLASACIQMVKQTPQWRLIVNSMMDATGMPMGMGMMTTMVSRMR